MMLNQKCYVNVGGLYTAVFFSDILYFYAEHKKLYLRTDGKTLLVQAASLKSLEIQLLDYYFIRVNRKYLVNLNRAKTLSLQDSKLRLDKNICLAIGKEYKKNLISKLLLF